MSSDATIPVNDSGRVLPRMGPLLGISGLLVVGLLEELRAAPVLRTSTFLLAAAALGFMMWGRNAQSDLLHPTRVFGGLWCGCLALASMQLLPLISSWGSKTWLCLLTPLVSFPVGVWLGGRASRRPKREQSFSRGANISAELVPQRRGLVIAALCLAIGTLVLGYEYHLIGEIPILSQNPDAARMKLFGVAGQVDDPQFDTLSIKLIHPFVEFNKYAIFLALLVLIQTGAKSRRVRIMSALIMFCGILVFGSQGGRTFLVEIAIVCVALLHYLRRRIRFREACGAVGALFLFVALYGSYRIQKSESAPLFERALSGSNLPAGPFWDGLAFGYATVTISFDVFDRLIDDLRWVERPPSGFLFYSFHRLIPRTNIQEFAFNLYSGESITPTFLGEFYGDYGYWGVLFGPLLFGVGYGWIYLHGEANPSLYWIYARAMFLQILVFFPYVNLFSQYLTWIFDLFFMYVLLHYATTGKWNALAATAPGVAKEL